MAGAVGALLGVLGQAEVVSLVVAAAIVLVGFLTATSEVWLRAGRAAAWSLRGRSGFHRPGGVVPGDVEVN